MVAGDTCIVEDGVYAQRLLLQSKSGTNANNIVFRARNPLGAEIRGATNTLHCISINDCDYIRIEDFYIHHAHTSPDKKNDHCVIMAGGSTHCTIDGCDITQIGFSPADADCEANYDAGWRTQGVTARANVTFPTVKNCRIHGVNKGINCTGVVDSLYVYNCELWTVQSAIHFISGEIGVHHHHVIDLCTVLRVFMEDGFQTLPDPGYPDGTTLDNVGILVMRTVFKGCQENVIDTKGGTVIFVEGCVWYEHTGSNDGLHSTLSGGPDTNSSNQVMCGANQISEHRTLINCISYNNNGGFTPHKKDNLINCTFWYNRHNKDGSGSATDITKFIACNFTESTSNPAIIVNNIFGLSYAGLGIRTAGTHAPYIDYNAYIRNDFPGRDVTNSQNFVSLGLWRAYLDTLAWVTGKEAHGVESTAAASDLFSSVTENPTGTHDNYDFTVRSTSPLYQAGGHVTTAVGAGTASLTIQLTNPYPFRGNWGRSDIGVVGHTIFIEGCGARVISDIDYATGVATLTAAGSWAGGAKVWMGSSNTPNIGSVNFGEGGGGGGGGGGDPVDITVVGTPINVSTAAGATLTLSGFTPQAHELALVAVMTRTNTVTHGVTGGGLTWTQAASVTMEGTNGKLTLWRAMSQTAPAGGDLTITATGNTGSLMATAWRLDGVNQEGTNGSGACEVVVTDDGPAAGASNFSMKTNITSLSDKSCCVAVGSHRSTTFTLPTGETAIKLNDHVGAGASNISLSVWYEVTNPAGTATLGADNDLSDNQWWVMIVVAVKPDTDSGAVTVDLSATFSDSTASTVDPVVTAGTSGITVAPPENDSTADTVAPTVTEGQTLDMSAVICDSVAETVDPLVFSAALGRIASNLRYRPLTLTLRKRGRNMFSREIVESPWEIGEQESWLKPVDTSAWGGSPSNSHVELKEVQDDGSLVSVALAGESREQGDFIVPPAIFGLTAGKKYRIEFRFDTNEETLECYGYIICTE